MLTQYLKMVERGEILYDLSQVSLIGLLESYSIKRNKFFYFMAKIKKRGVYIYGGVGRGKSMIMNLYYNNCDIVQKKKIHFDHLIGNLHHDLNKLQAKGISDPLKVMAHNIASQFHLLCIDEFRVSDVTDSVIFSRLFSILFSCNIIIIITSNYHPDELYKDGLRRELFVSTIDIMLKNLDIINFDGKSDYRMTKVNFSKDSYFIGIENYKYLNVLFEKLTKGIYFYNTELNNRSRKIIVKKSCNDIAWFNFNELCQKPLWVSDYLLIVQQFSTIFLEEIPGFNFYNQNERQRFTILIDILYDNDNKLFCSMEVEPVNLYLGKEEIPLEFQRTISRLVEIRARSGEK